MRQVGPYLLRAQETRAVSSLVREDWEERTSGLSVVPLGARLSSQRTAGAYYQGSLREYPALFGLKASKREALGKNRSPALFEHRLLEDHQVDRPDVYGRQLLELTGTNSQPLGRFDPWLGPLASKRQLLPLPRNIADCRMQIAD